MRFPGRVPTGLAASLIAAVALAGPSGAQDETVAFPFTASGAWEGQFVFEGYIAHDGESDDGSFRTGQTDVMGDTKITLDLVVDESGKVTGTMPVHLVTKSLGVGADSGGYPFHIVHQIVQHGELSLSGDAARIVAQGTLDEESKTYSEMEIIESMTETETVEVEWVFSFGHFDCHKGFAPLMEADGSSLVRSALNPPEWETHDATHWTNLAAHLVVWPKGNASSDILDSAEKHLEQLADELMERTVPYAIHLTDLIDAWADVQAEMAALNECVTDGGYYSSHLDWPWVIGMLTRALGVAVENADAYFAQELIDLWLIGQSALAMPPEMSTQYMRALHGMLDDAIAAGDTETIELLADFANEHDKHSLKEKSEAALE